MINRYWRAVWIVCLTVALTACGNAASGSRSAASSAAEAGTTVQMNNTRFEPESITIQSGQSLTLIASTFVPHVIANGTWANGEAKPAREPGAPEVKDVNIAGNSSGAIGPFATPGTYQLYCTIHPKMNLAVVVQ
jgi:plastocyanin